LFYQERTILTVYNNYLEVLLLDATYKLTELRMPLYVMMAIGGNGHSEIVVIYLTLSQTAASLS